MRPDPWLEVGQLVQRMDSGATYFSDPKGPNKGQPSLAADAKGVVVKINPPEAPHRCPNHDELPDCVCAGDFGEDAMIPGKTSSAVVAWTLSDGKKIRRLVWPKDEGSRWAKLCSICERPKDDRPWTRNGGTPAHTECALGQSVKALEDAGLRPKGRPKKKARKT